MNAVVCACGRRIEDDTGFLSPRAMMDMFRTPGHDPDECSRNVGFEHRYEGRREMALAAVAHLYGRATLSGEEIAEIRTNLLDMVIHLPKGASV